MFDNWFKGPKALILDLRFEKDSGGWHLNNRDAS